MKKRLAIDPDSTAIDPDSTAIDPDSTAIDPDSTAIDPDSTPSPTVLRAHRAPGQAHIMMAAWLVLIAEQSIQNETLRPGVARAFQALTLGELTPRTLRVAASIIVGKHLPKLGTPSHEARLEALKDMLLAMDAPDCPLDVAFGELAANAKGVEALLDWIDATPVGEGRRARGSVGPVTAKCILAAGAVGERALPPGAKREAKAEFIARRLKKERHEEGVKL